MTRSSPWIPSLDTDPHRPPFAPILEPNSSADHPAPSPALSEALLTDNLDDFVADTVLDHLPSVAFDLLPECTDRILSEFMTARFRDVATEALTSFEEPFVIVPVLQTATLQNFLTMLPPRTTIALGNCRFP